VGAEEGVVCGGKTNLIADGFRLRADINQEITRNKATMYLRFF
jgi:hypothetical protein